MTDKISQAKSSIIQDFQHLFFVVITFKMVSNFRIHAIITPYCLKIGFDFCFSGYIISCSPAAVFGGD